MTASVYTKPAVRHAWAETAGTADLVDPGDTYAEAGWLQSTTPPPRQYFNWVLQYSTIGVRYLCQNGIATWDANEQYPTNAITLYNGTLYQAIAANTGYEPDTSPGQWGAVGVAQPPPGSASNSAATTAWVASGFLHTGSSFADIAGSVSAAQVPQGAVTQFEGALLIAWGQITGTKDADELQGYTAASTATANTVALRDGGGNLWTTYFNQGSANGENPSISQVMVTNGSDGFLRKAGIGYFQQSLSIAWGQLTGTKNADELQGYTVNTGGVASSVALRDANGGLTAATFNVSSDATLKTNVQPITDALSRLDSLCGVTFDMLRPGDSTRAGVIAQHVRAALPEAVRGKDKLTVDPMGVIGLLVAALKEETAARRALEARLSRIDGIAP